MAWLTGWNYRKSHVINPQTGAGTNYPVCVKVYKTTGTDGTETIGGVTAGKVYVGSHCRDDFGDIRFTDNDETTLLDYWMESYVSGTYAIFWVEVADSLESNPATIYVYYDKSDATSVSNIANTFSFGDDFELNNFSRWSSAGNSWSISSTTVWQGIYSAKGGVGSNRILDKNFSPAPIKYRVLFNVLVNDATNDRYCCIPLDGAIVKYVLFIYAEKFKYNDGTTKNLPTDTTCLDNTWYKVELLIDWDTDKIRYHIDDAYKGEVTSITAKVMDILRVYGANAADAIFIDNYIIMKWVTPEPAHSTWGAEESLMVGMAYGCVPVLTQLISMFSLKTLNSIFRKLPILGKYI